MILSKSLPCTVVYGITVAALIVQECSLFRNFQNLVISVASPGFTYPSRRPNIWVVRKTRGWGLSFFVKECCFRVRVSVNPKTAFCKKDRRQPRVLLTTQHLPILFDLRSTK